MSLLDFLRPQQAQVPGQQSPFQNLLAPEVALPTAMMLMGGQGNAQNFANAAGVLGPALGQQKQLQAQTAEKNRTLDFFRQQAPEYAAMIDAGMPVGDAWQEYNRARTAKPQISEYEERSAAAKQYGLTGDDAMSFILTGNLPSGRFGSAEVGLQMIPVYDEKGNVTYVQPSKSGSAIQTQFPEGYKPLSPFDTSQQKAAGTESGKLQGGAAFDLPRVEQNAAQSLGVLNRMKTHPGREGSTGFVQGMLPSRSSEQVDFQSLVDQTQGQSFLQAFQMLKGAGQITEIEGLKATQAISRLGNQRLSDADYLKAIEDLEEVINNGLARARQQAGQGGQPSYGAPAQSGGVVDYTDFF